MSSIATINMSEHDGLTEWQTSLTSSLDGWHGLNAYHLKVSVSASDYFYLVGMRKKTFGKYFYHCMPFSLPTQISTPGLDSVTVSNALEDAARFSNSILFAQDPHNDIFNNISQSQAWSRTSTHVLNLNNLASPDVFESFPADLKREIRKAQRHNVEIISGNDQFAIDAFFKLYQKSVIARGQTVKKYDYDFFSKIARCRCVEFKMAKINNEVVASIILLHGSFDTLYWFSAFDRRFGNISATHLLLYKAIQEATTLGRRYFNFGASDRLPSLSKFKKSFGAKPLTYSRYLFGGIEAKVIAFGMRTKHALLDTLGSKDLKHE